MLYMLVIRSEHIIRYVKKLISCLLVDKGDLDRGTQDPCSRTTEHK